MSEQEKDIAVLYNKYKNIEDKLDQIHDDFKSFQKKCDNSYASKEEVTNNKKRINRIEKIVDKLFFIAITGIVSALGILGVGAIYFIKSIM